VTQFRCIIANAASKWPQNIALIDGEQHFTYQQLSAVINKACISLQKISPNTEEILGFKVSGQLNDIIRLLAAQRLGRCILPINPKLSAALLQRILVNIKYVDWNSQLDLTPALEISTPAMETVSKDNFAANWLLTSGSTALPKIAVIGIQNHIRSAEGSLSINSSGPGDRYLQSLPLFHISGLATLYRCLLSGATLVMDRSNGQAQWFIDKKITHVSLVPTQLDRLLVQETQGEFSFKQVLLGGGPVPASMSSYKLGLPIMQTYGLTEMASQVITREVGGQDQLLPNRQLKIAEDGEVLVKGATLFLGYQTIKGIELPLDDHGWFHTRDIGRWQDGCFSIIGRKDNQFISGGENIQPETIEARLQQHPAINRAIVVPLKDKTYGYRPFAFIEYAFESNDVLSTEILESWTHSELPPYMRPVAFQHLSDQDGLKISRPDLIKLAEQIVYDSLV